MDLEGAEGRVGGALDLHEDNVLRRVAAVEQCGGDRQQGGEMRRDPA